MENNDVIFNRKSVRFYNGKQISKDDFDLILKAAQAGPTAVNVRGWEFIVIDDKNILKDLKELIGRTCFMLENADKALLVLGNTELSYANDLGYHVVDACIATQNAILEATRLGIGSVWLGVYPQEVRMNKLTEYFKLPSHIVPVSLVAFGYESAEEKNTVKNIFEENKVHFNKW